MRKLQYIFNVLMSEGVIELVDDPEGTVYYIKKTDPFYITNKEWAAMRKRFNEKHPE